MSLISTESYAQVSTVEFKKPNGDERFKISVGDKVRYKRIGHLNFFNRKGIVEEVSQTGMVVAGESYRFDELSMIKKVNHKNLWVKILLGTVLTLSIVFGIIFVLFVNPGSLLTLLIFAFLVVGSLISLATINLREKIIFDLHNYSVEIVTSEIGP